jgi:hypothetical protein
MIAFEDLVYFRHCKVIDSFKFMYLFLKHDSFMTAYLVFVNNIDSPCKRSLLMYCFPQLIKLILFDARRQNVIFLLDTALNFFDKIILLKFYVVLLTHHPGSAIFMGFLNGIPHIKFDNRMRLLN